MFSNGLKVISVLDMFTCVELIGPGKPSRISGGRMSRSKRNMNQEFRNALMTNTHTKFRTTPAFTISLILMYPVAKTMAFGAVATGSMKAREHDKAVAYSKKSGFTSREMANCAIMGAKMVVVAALLVTSVIKDIDNDSRRTVSHGGRPDIDVRCEPTHADKPDF